MKDFIYYGSLFTIYNKLLSASAQKYYSLYYEENLTLQEIADLEKVSKSYIGSVIKKTTEKLDDYENKLHIYENNKNLENALEFENIKEIKSTIKKILSK